MIDIFTKSKNPTVLILEDDFVYTDGLRKVLESEILITRGENVDCTLYKEVLETYAKFFIKNPEAFELYKVFTLTGYPIMFRPLGNYYLMEELAYDELGRPVFINGLENSKIVWKTIESKLDFVEISNSILNKKVLVEKDLLMDWDLDRKIRAFKGVGDEKYLGLVFLSAEKETNFELVEVTFSKVLYYTPELISLLLLEVGLEINGTLRNLNKEDAIMNSKYARIPVKMLLSRKESAL